MSERRLHSRRGFACASAVSLILLVVTVALWARDGRDQEWIARSKPPNYMEVLSYRRHLWLTWASAMRAQPVGWSHTTWRGGRSPRTFRFIGSGMEQIDGVRVATVYSGPVPGRQGTYAVIQINDGFMALVFAMAPLAYIAAVFRLRWRRQQHGFPVDPLPHSSDENP